MQNFWSKIKLIWTETTLRKKVLFVFLALIVFRLLSAIPIPGIDTAELTRFLSNNQFFGILNIFSGGGLSNLSIIMLGVGPYITGSIIMQLLTIMVPALKRIYHEKGKIKLVSANQKMKPFYEDNVEIQGKVVGVLRKEI